MVKHQTFCHSIASSTHRAVVAAARNTAMKIVGLTGGIACGKSTVSAWLRRREIAVVDLDEIVRRLQKPRTRVVYELGRSFPGVVDADGCLDRGKLGSLIFNDAAQRRKLNVLMRGHILRAMGLELLGHFLAGTRLVVLDAPLLFETAGLSSICASYVVVGTSSDQQLARLVERDGCDEAAAKAKINAQMPLAAKLQRAHVPVMNLGTVGELEDQLERTVAPALWRRANLWWFLSLPGLFVLWVLVFRGAFLYMLATCLASEEMKCFTDFLDGADADPEPGEA